MATAEKKYKVLIAEDDPVSQQILTLGLKDQKFDVRAVSNGEEALISYKEWCPDIILLDIVMPQMNGYKTLKEIRTTLEDKSTTVIMVSNVTDKEEILACAKLGIQGYVVKPIEAKKIAATVLSYHTKNKK